MNGLRKHRWIVLLGACAAATPVWLLTGDAGNLAQANELAIIQPALVAGSQFNYWTPSNEEEAIEFRITELEEKLRDLRLRYTDKHPEVVRTQRELDELLSRHPNARRLLRRVSPYVNRVSPVIMGTTFIRTALSLQVPPDRF